MSVHDQAAGEFGERFVDISSAFPADTQASEAVQPSEGPLDHPPVGPQSCAIPGSTPCDRWHDAASVDLGAVQVVVIATVSEEPVWLTARAALSAALALEGQSSKGRS